MKIRGGDTSEDQTAPCAPSCPLRTFTSDFALDDMTVRSESEVEKESHDDKSVSEHRALALATDGS
jgi:hypothetical protein